jgi:hypothetical protein
VSIYDAVRGDDDSGRASTVPDPDSVPDQTLRVPNAPPTSPRQQRPRPSALAGSLAPIVAPEVISSKAALLASADDFAVGADCSVAADDERCFEDDAEKDGIVRWTVKYVDRALDDIEREKPAAADVAWRINRAGERAVNNPTVRRGARLTADVGLEVLKVGVKAAAPVLGNIGKFAAKQAFGAAVSGLTKNPDGAPGEKKMMEKKTGERSAETSAPSKRKKIVKLTAEEAEARRKAGKTVRKVEKKKGGFFGM